MEPPPPYGPAHLNARAAARYDAHHPPPALLLHDPRFYPHPPPPPPPQPRHHHRDHRLPADDDPRFYYPPPPPLFPPSDRLLVPHPPWDGSAEDFEFLEYEARRGQRPPHRGPPHFSEETEAGFAGRKRRWAQDWTFEDEVEDDRRSHKRMEFVAGEGRRHDPFCDQVPLPLLPGSPPRGSRQGSVDHGRDAFRGLPPPYWSSGHSCADIELVERSKNDDGFRDNRFIGNKGKRRMVNNNWYGEDSHRNSMRKSPWKPNASNRMQCGVSVWDRIKEKLPSPSPRPPSPPHECEIVDGFSEQQQPEVDRLDLSYKSTGLVAKVLVPPSPVEPSIDVKVPPTDVPKKKLVKKLVKKKVMKKREKVVVHIIPGSSSSEAKGVTEKPVSSSPLEASRQLEKATASSVKPIKTASPQACPKRVVGLASVGKTSTKGVPKSNTKKGGISEVPKEGHSKISTPKKGMRKCAGAKASEVTVKNENNLQLCQQQVSVAKISTKRGALEQSNVPDDLVKHVITKEIEEGECTALDVEVAPDCPSSLVADTATMNDSILPHSTQEMTEIRASFVNHALKGFKSIASLENLMGVDPTVEVRADVMDVKKFVCADVASAASTPQESNGSDHVNQVMVFAASLTSSSDVDSSKGMGEENGRLEEEKECQVQVDTVMEKIETLDGGKSKSIDACLHSHLQDMPVLLPLEINSIVSDISSPNVSRDHEFSCLSKPVSDRPSTSNGLRLVADSQVVSMIESAGDRIERTSAFALSEIESLAGTSTFKDATHQMATEKSLLQLSHGKGCVDTKGSNRNDERQSHKDYTSLISDSSLVLEAEEEADAGKTILNKKRVCENTLAPHGSEKQKNKYLKVTGGEIATKKTIVSARVPRVLPNRESMGGLSKQTARFNARHRTWQRSNATTTVSPSHGNLQLQGGTSFNKKSPKNSMLPSSYTRKGNTLIRNSATEVTLHRTSQGLAASNRVDRSAIVGLKGLESKVKYSNQGNRSTSSSYIERPKTPPLPLATKLQNSITKPTEDVSHQILRDIIYETGVEGQGEPSESQTVDLVCGDVNNNSISGDRNSEPSSTRTMIYVKRKSNQLVAAAGPVFGETSVHHTEMPQTVPPFTSRDLYYRRKNNQLIRNALPSEVQYKQDVDISNSNDQTVSHISKWNATGPFRKRIDKVMRKTHKQSKFSLVWTLSGGSHRKGVDSLNRWNVLPSIFPWKRTLHWKSSASIPSRLPLSQISRKLQFTRKRNTIYKVSTDGFSLHKAGVLSVGGSSLKWSKSIERRSKKASEEATLAVAEAERKRRERKKNTIIGANGKSGNRLHRKSASGIELQQGERVFRIGSARYKMDSSRRTLLRIPDEKSTCVLDRQSENKNKKSFIPRRLLIDNDEYIRVGNGNKLIRDPKKLKQILASEKVRWSLHTVRQRLARKQQYCQFFTRFGKCKKNGGKCPYIHDPTKVAICTKFLRGVCSNTNCRLTHKMIPERMPDCSYFLQGLCTNINCPYRHVNVNPKASVCEGFLRGYCANGDECRKKHSYVCPVFEATGKCPQGSACRLHHPKSINKTKKRKRTNVQSNGTGRYFGSSIIEAGKPLVVNPDNCDVENGVDLFCHDGQFTDYISLDVGSDDDAVQTNVAMDSHLVHVDSDLADLEPDDLDALIKPVRIMNRDSTTSVLVPPLK